MADYAAGLQAGTAVRPLWGTAQLFAEPHYMVGPGALGRGAGRGPEAGGEARGGGAREGGVTCCWRV
jgi:hypothetical protein